MTEKACKRCSACCQVLPLFTQHMHPKYREYLLNRGLVEDKQQGCILIPHVFQHLLPDLEVNGTIDRRDGQGEIEGMRLNRISFRSKYTGKYTCDIHDDPDRPEVCRKFRGQKILKGARVYIPPGCSFREEP